MFSGCMAVVVVTLSSWRAGLELVIVPVQVASTCREEGGGLVMFGGDSAGL